MNKKTINKIITRKINDWLSSIEDKTIREIAAENTIVTGGSITSLLLGEKVKDFDLYFKTKEAAKRIAEYYVRRFNQSNEDKAKVMVVEDRVKIYVPSRGVAAETPEVLEAPFEDAVEELEEVEETTKGKKYRPIFLSSNAITLSNKIQIVVRFYGEPSKIHETYDFVHCMNYWTPQEKVVLKQEALEATLAKELVYAGSKYPICSVIRTRKFLKRGWYINAGQYLKMLFQVSEMDLTDLEVLEDQLVGVDSAYFLMLINALKKKKENDSSFVVTSSYLAEIIDRIF